MKDFFPAALEFFIFVPGLLIAYLPVKQHLKIHPRILLPLTAGLALFLCLAGGGLCYFLSVRAVWIFFPTALAAGLFYVCTLTISPWKSASVFLAVCGVFSCLGNAANAIDILLSPAPARFSLSLGAALFYNLICWAAVFLVWYPTAHATKSLLEEDIFAQTWYVFWILPILFIGFNLFFYSFPIFLTQKILIQMYLAISLSLYLLLLLFYMLFYLIAANLIRNAKLHQENQFLSLQQARYDSLCAAIAETRESRHDMRHHFHVLQGLAANHEWDNLTDYLAKASEQIPNAGLNLCENTATDAIACHYRMLYQKHKIPCSFALDLPRQLPVPETDLCLTLSNLLENALEASLRTAPEKRRIRVQAYLHFDRMVLLTVENAFDGVISEKNNVFISSKRKGGGIGIQSVRHIAERNGGYSRFLYGNGIFCANVMLRREK